MLNYTVRENNGVKIIDLSGTLTAQDEETFKSLVQRITEKESVIINLENITLVSSSGLSSLVDVSFFAKEHGTRVIYVWPSDDLIRLAEDMDVYAFLLFAGSIEEGQTKIKYFT
ncbi:MAG TPA: STAS domain-containing protein [Spirochaetota bacterium]|nr:STAS domain-containing protein [Spirochaetota bacterium]HRZ26589.1 STAS domain-containing protein [Spirochaetota bacterium]HSA14198.1 STAS domain-containing protein [Spirochaetota bacterium]